MLKLMRGELYRLLHKKSMYIYFGALAVTYALVVYVRSGGFSAQSVVSDAMNFFNFLPALAGGFLFAALYTDDLNSKNLIALVGFGVSKTKIVVTRFILMALLSALVFALVPLFHGMLYTLLGWAPAQVAWTTIYAASLKYFLMTVAFAALAGIVVYGLQRTTFSMVLYILLAFNVVSGLITVVLKTFAPNLSNYLMASISDRIMLAAMGSGSLVTPIVLYVAYVACAGALSVLAFHKKEMEF
ncbi:MAG: hypothetical protein FWF45_07575 [Coriobacteriia bacterium]|nr:hypothetical protein [Coriobacteriia bacterium]